MLSLTNIARTILLEKMTYDQLFRISTPSRKERMGDVRVNKLPVLASRDGSYWNFGYKSGNSTTGKSWKGRISFNRVSENVTADKLPCFVDCGCPDYKYRWAYANNSKEAGPLGWNSLNKSNGSPAVAMNPKNQPGLCKHLLALKAELHKKINQSQKPTLREQLDEVVDQNPQFDVEYID